MVIIAVSILGAYHLPFVGSVLCSVNVTPLLVVRCICQLIRFEAIESRAED